MDFETDVVIWFGAVYGSSCPIRLDDVIVDTERRVVHGHFVKPGNPTVCTLDANPESYVVALDRSRLPEAPFAIQLDADDPPPGAPEERTTVGVDLRAAGSTASAGDLVVESLGDNPASESTVFEPGLVLEDTYPSIVRLDLTCSIGVLGPINGVMWRATDTGFSAGPPAEWIASSDDEVVEAELLLTTNPANLKVTVNDRTVEYEPIPASGRAQMVCD